MKIRHTALLLGLFTFAAINAHGTITLYTDRSTWETAAGGGTGDLLDNFTTGTLSGTNIFRAGYSISGPVLVAFPNANVQTTIDGSGYFRAILQSSTTNFFTFSFTNAILALGYDLNPQFSNLGASVDFMTNGIFAGTYNLPATDVNGFFGLVSTDPFTTFEITPNNDTAWHGIDNLEAYHATIPEPSPLALGAIGAVVACVSKRRRD